MVCSHISTSNADSIQARPGNRLRCLDFGDCLRNLVFGKFPSLRVSRSRLARFSGTPNPHSEINPRDRRAMSRSRAKAKGVSSGAARSGPISQNRATQERLSLKAPVQPPHRCRVVPKCLLLRRVHSEVDTENQAGPVEICRQGWKLSNTYNGSPCCPINPDLMGALD